MKVLMTIPNRTISKQNVYEKGVLKICSENKLLVIFGTPLSRNTSEWLLLHFIHHFPTS